MKKRVKERKKSVRNSKRKSEKRRWSSLRFYDITLEIIVLLFVASMAAVMYTGGIESLASVLLLTLSFIAILVFALGILHHAIKKRAWFVALLITVLVIAGVISYAFFLYLGLFTAVLFYFIVLRKEFK